MPGIFVSMFAAAALVFAFTDPSVDQFKRIWFFCMLAVLILRLADVFFWKAKQKNSDFDIKKAIYRITVSIQLTAIMWSVYALGILSKVDSIELTATIIAYCALAGGAATVLAAHKYTAIMYTLFVLFPISLGLMVSTEDYQQLLGIMGMAFSLVMILIVKKTAEFTTTAVELKNENAVLVQYMEERVERRTKKIHELSNLDPLTHLLNRNAFLRHFKVELESAIESKHSIILLFIDLDGFKKINDTLGHKVGDKLLAQTARKIRRVCSEDYIISRWGGDEFLVAINDIREDEAVVQANRIIESIAEAYTLENNPLFMSATIGISSYPKHADSAEDLIQLADTAMYYQKKQMPATASIFSSDLGRKIAREQRLRDAFIQAIEKHQLKLVFHPIVSSKTGKVKSFEALLRWQLEDEHIYPNEFIQVAEQYGFIGKIGEWALQQACLIASQWDKSQNIAVSVNVSVIQLQDKNFLDIVDAALAKSQLPAELLNIEITESVFADDKDIVLKRIKSLQSKGIQVSIDDFGTGYSSLSVMQDLAVNIVKIDRSFVDSMETKGLAIVSAVMNIADTLNYKVVVEGVESKKQAKILSDMGVHYQQGFYYSVPLEEEEIDEFVSRLSNKLSNVVKLR